MHAVENVLIVGAGMCGMVTLPRSFIQWRLESDDRRCPVGR